MLYGVGQVAVGRSSTLLRCMFRKAVKQCEFDLKEIYDKLVCQRIPSIS
ncbi:hypothetical protein [Porphyromonas gulae]|nr:hypothetical protein [Porphyromonas gulae]